MRISRNASVALDLLRGAAALTVFLHHTDMFDLDAGALAWFRRDVGHSAVVIFFVLSGYVIASTLPSGGGALEYAIRRAARIYSVAIPALILTLLLDFVMVHWGLAPDVPVYQLHRAWIYLPIALTFTGHFWNLSEPAFSNTPYWSLTYEVWYYVLFAIAVFGRGVTRWALLFAILFAMGPKLWLLLPTWAGGVLIAHLWRWKQMARGQCRLLVLATLGLFIIAKTMHWEDPVNELAQAAVAGWFPFPLGFSQWFAGDFCIGCLTMGLVYGVGGAAFQFPASLGMAITGFAKLSFGLYLVHYPMLLIWHGLLPGHGWATMGLSLLCALGFAALAEPQKTHARRLLAWLAGRLPRGSRDELLAAEINRGPISERPGLAPPDTHT